MESLSSWHLLVADMDALPTGAAVFITNHVLNRDMGEVFAAGAGFLLRRDPDTVRAPDVAFVSSERLGTSEAPSGFLERAPDLAVEVVSPTRFCRGRSEQGRGLAGSRYAARVGRVPRYTVSDCLPVPE